MADFFDVVVRQEIGEFFDGLFRGVDQAVRVDQQVGEIFFLAVFVLVFFRLFLHAQNLFFIQTRGGGHPNVLFFAGAQVFCRDGNDAVCVNVKAEFDLRHAARGRWDADQFKTAQALVVLGHFTLTLQNVYADHVLIVTSSGKDLALAGRDGGVFLDQLGGDATGGLYTQTQRGDV